MKNRKSLQERLPKLLSHPPVIFGICLVVFILFMILWNFAVKGLVEAVLQLRAGQISGFQFPNPFVFDFGTYGWMYLFGAVLALLIAGRLAYQMRLSYRPLEEKQQKGEERWATPEEIRERFRAVPERGSFFPGKPGFPVSRIKKQIYIEDRMVNICLCGSPRSGKGEIFIFGAIDIFSRARDIAERFSLIVADPKGELAAASKATLEKRGYTVWILDLIDLMGMSYNPLELVREAYLSGDVRKAQTLTNTLSYTMFYDETAREKHWQNWSISLTNALILAVVEDCCKKAEETGDKNYWYSKINMYSAVRLLIDHDNPDSKGIYPIDTFFLNRPEGDPARLQYSAVAAAGDRQKGNIISNTLNVLTQFTLDPVARMTASSSMNMRDIGFDLEKPTAVFLTMPDYDRSKDFLVSMFISQVYYTLSEAASHSPRGKCPREVVFLLDEFGNIPPIPNMSNMLTVCPGRNILFVLAVQAYSQIYKKYGKEDGETIINGCIDQIFLLSIDPDSAKLFSSMLGSETIDVFSKQGNPMELNKKFSTHIDTKPLMTPNQLMRLQEGECILVSARNYPIYNHGRTRMKFRHQYLSQDFDNSGSLADLHLEQSCTHKLIDLQQIIYQPDPETYTRKPEFPQEIPFEEPAAFTKLPPRSQRLILNLMELEQVPDEQCTQIPQMTFTQLDTFLQELVDTGQIRESTYEDIQVILEKEAKR